MNHHYLSLIDKIDDIKYDIKEDKYLDLMNTVKILYDNSFISKINNHNDSDNDSDDYSDDDSESDNESYYDYTQDMFFTMFEEYTCKCRRYTCESLCCTSFNLFRYCNNYQRIITFCPEINYIMKLHFHNIESNHKIKFIRDITVYNDQIFDNKCRFNEIVNLLSKFSILSKNNIVLKHTIILILCNFCFKYFVHIKNDRFKITLYKRIYEIIQYNRYRNTSFSDILIECGETTDILHHWIRNIRRFLPADINTRLNIGNRR